MKTGITLREKRREGEEERGRRGEGEMRREGDEERYEA